MGRDEEGDEEWRETAEEHCTVGKARRGGRRAALSAASQLS